MTDRPTLSPQRALLAGLALAAGLALPVALSAQDAATPPAGFAAADTDGDGVISPAEWAAMLQRMGPRQRAGLTGDRTAAMETRAAAMLTLFDRDGDGSLTAEEIVTGMQALADLRGGFGPGMGSGAGPDARGPRDAARRGWTGGAPMPMAFDRIDADGDGVISRDEWTAAMERWTEMRGERPRGEGRSWR